MFEEEKRVEAFRKIIELINQAEDTALDLIEYPEMNVAHIEIREAIAGIMERIGSLAMRPSKEMLFFAHQLNVNEFKRKK